jgi:hypothetical protein
MNAVIIFYETICFLVIAAYAVCAVADYLNNR